MLRRRMPASTSPAPDRRPLVALASLCGALALACGWLAWRLAAAASGAVFYSEDALRDPDIRREIVRSLTFVPAG